MNTDWLPASEDAVIATEREHSLVVESFSISGDDLDAFSLQEEMILVRMP